MRAGYQSWNLGELNGRSRGCFQGVIWDAGWGETKNVFKWPFKDMQDVH